MNVTRCLSMLFVTLGVSATLAAQEKRPGPGENAALRYWMAFALMENPRDDGDLSQRLERVAGGQEPWDDRLASILKKNGDALATMHRGSTLSFCDWGLEHTRLASAPIANVPRARALARLNVVYGIYLQRQGRMAEAVDAWLAGLRFSRDIAADGPLLSALVAGGSLKAHYDVLARATEDGRFDATLRRNLQREVAGYSAAGFDWSVAVRHESELISALVAQVERASDPLSVLRDEYDFAGGARTPERLAQALGISIAQISDPEAARGALRQARALNDALRPSLIAAFQMPYERSIVIVQELDARAQQNPALSMLLPTLARTNHARGQVVQARDELLRILNR